MQWLDIFPKGSMEITWRWEACHFKLQSKPLLRPQPYQRTKRIFSTVMFWQGWMSLSSSRKNSRGKIGGLGFKRSGFEKMDVPLHLCQQYFTFEGWFNRVSLYHFYFLPHLAAQIKINPSSYFLESLKHMEDRFKAHTDPSSHFICHNALIKLLIKNQLAKVESTWSHFLFGEVFNLNHLKDEEADQRLPKKRRKLKIKPLLSYLPAKKTWKFHLHHLVKKFPKSNRGKVPSFIN